MKKIMLLAAIVAVFCSCHKTDVITKSQPEGIPVRVNFAGAGGAYDTRAFFDNTAEAELWEKKIHQLSLYVFNDAGNVIMVKHLTEAEINSLNGMVYLHESVTGRECSIYAVANYNVTSVVSKTEDLFKSSATNINMYNGYFYHISVGTMQAKGFAMTGHTTITVSENATAVITLKRLMAKVAVQIETANDFPVRYGGAALWVQSVQLCNVQKNSYLFPGSGPDPSWPLDNTLDQESEIKGNISNNLFYIHEQNPCSPGSESYMLVSLRFDQDGNRNTRNDQITKPIQVPLQGSGSGEIKRNGYYRIKGIVTDFDALHLYSTFSVEEWETPQTTDLGNITI